MSDQPQSPRSAHRGPDDDAMDDDDDLNISALAPSRPSLERVPLARLRRPLRRVWRASGVVALLALAAIVIVAVGPHLPRPPRMRVQIPYRSLSVTTTEARCLVGSAWSHDGRQIAAIESSPCGSPYTGPNVSLPNLVLFDAATGRQVADYIIDPAVNAALTQIGLSASGQASYAVSYFDANWSPDGRQIEVDFGVFGELGGDAGVAIISVAGAQRGQIRVFLGTPNAADGLTVSAFGLIPLERWNLANGSHTTIYLEPALAYHWLPSDVLVADDPLPTNGKASAPVESAAPSGLSIGGQSFSMWRAATIYPVTAAVCDGNGVTVGPLSQPYALLTLSATAWSPDGRYLLNIYTQARLPTAPGHPARSGSGFTPCDAGPAPDQVPSAPLHDNGLRAALRLLDAQGGNQLTLAWTPDGKRVAVTTDTLAQAAGTLAVYDCASGAALQRFGASDFEAQVGQYSLASGPVWSPDGRSLLLTVSLPAAKLVVLGPQALGT